MAERKRNGKGFDEMTGWYLCDGRNGAPDLRGRFITGRHPDWSDYRIGVHGGNNQVQLSEAKMPQHTHLGFLIFIYISCLHILIIYIF